MKGGLDERVHDEALVRIYQRDPEGSAGRRAAEALFERYQERVYLWCYRRVRDHDVACDLAQDVLVNAYRALRSFRGQARYSTWLFTITRNRCLRALRRPALLRDEEVEPDGLVDALDPESEFLERERERDLLRLANETLDPEERLALWLRAFELLPLSEITRRLGIGSASGARGLLQNARRKLRRARDREREGRRS